MTTTRQALAATTAAGHAKVPKGEAGGAAAVASPNGDAADVSAGYPTGHTAATATAAAITAADDAAEVGADLRFEARHGAGAAGAGPELLPTNFIPGAPC